jgi:hypothetical protein
MKNTIAKVLALLVLSSLGTVSSLKADSVGLALDSGTLTLNNVGDLTALSSGDVLQFGYYTGATNSSTLFSGNFIALTGTGGVNSGLTFTQIGQETANGAGPGKFAFNSSNITFTSGMGSTTGVSLPSAGQIMAIRFYNAANLSLATFYGAASDTSWQWVAPAAIPPVAMTFTLNDSGVTFLNGDAYTGTATATLLVPEPSSVALFCLGLGALALLGWRRGKLALA